MVNRRVNHKLMPVLELRKRLKRQRLDRKAPWLPLTYQVLVSNSGATHLPPPSELIIPRARTECSVGPTYTQGSTSQNTTTTALDEGWTLLDRKTKSTAPNSKGRGSGLGEQPPRTPSGSKIQASRKIKRYDGQSEKRGASNCRRAWRGPQRVAGSVRGRITGAQRFGRPWRATHLPRSKPAETEILKCPTDSPLRDFRFLEVNTNDKKSSRPPRQKHTQRPPTQNL